jgi:hypothetical protein
MMNMAKGRECKPVCLSAKGGTMRSAFLKKLSHILSITVIFFLFVGSVRAAPGDLTRVSVDSSGAQADAMTYYGIISASGRFVVFESEAGNLVPGDTNGLSDVFMHDRQLGTTTRVSVDASGAQVAGGGGAPTVSTDGHFVAFSSGATSLVTGDTNNVEDIFVKDTQTGAITRISLDSSGAQANNDSSAPSISGDGRYVAFASDASNLVPNDTNGVGDIFVHDRQTGATIRASGDANAGAFDPSISQSGHFVVFRSNASNLVAGDTNGVADIFMYGILTGQIARVSISSTGQQGDRASLDPSISGDGRYVSFSSASHTFFSGETNELAYTYVHDNQSGSLTLASFQNGSPMLGDADATSISADGRYVAFSFDEWGDGLARRRIYVHDRVTNQSISIAPHASDEQNPLLPSISGDGRFVAFASPAALVPGDTNGVRDVFVREVSYPVDLNPTVTSSAHGCPNGCGGPGDQVVSFLVKFSESVSGVDVSDFALTVGGGISGASVTGVGGAGSDYVVTVNTGSGDGTLRLDVIDDDSIKDFTPNALGGSGAGNGSFTSGGVYVVDKNVPTVSGVTRLDASPSMQGSVRFAVNFSEPVTGVDASDFSLVATGSISSSGLSDVSGSGASYTVTINTGTGDGTLQLNLTDNDSIIDQVSSPLGGVGSGNGNFTSGEIYTFERNIPAISSILRMDANPSSAQTVNFRLTFSESVTGVDLSDFAVNVSGISGASLIAVNGSGNSYAVTVGTGTGNGSLRLDLIDNDSILDSANNPLGGVGAGNGSLSGETYTINKVTVSYSTATFRSNGSNDGWVLESSENSNVGGGVNANEPTFKLGDTAKDQQYKAILHFPTEGLPDNAVITSAILTIKRKNMAGTNPFTTHQNITIDIATGNFGFDSYLGSYALQPLDFQAPSTLNNVGTIQNNPVGDVYWTLLSGDGNRFINLKGVTQFRLAFQLDDNDDLGDDFISFFSGDTPQQLDRPHLQIEYYISR